MRLPQPILQLADGRIRMILHPSADRIIERGELGLHPAALWSRRGLAGKTFDT
jgi:hypothetical protein